MVSSYNQIIRVILKGNERIIIRHILSCLTNIMYLHVCHILILLNKQPIQYIPSIGKKEKIKKLGSHK